MSDALTNNDAECVLLGLLMSENSTIDAVADMVAPADFAEPFHGRIYETIIRQASLGKPATALSLRGFFEGDDAINEFGGLRYLMDLTMSGAMLASPHEVAKQIVELADRRRMRAHLATASDACSDLTQTVGEIISFADSALSPQGKDLIHQPTAGECMDELLASFRAKRDGVTCRNIPTLDSLVGPMRPKQLIIGAARPGMGKTALAISYALGAARHGHGVLFVSLEMSSVEIAARMASDVCFNDDNWKGVPYSAIRDGDLHASQEREVIEAAEYVHSLPLQIVDTGNLTIGRLNMMIRRHARRMAAKGCKLELVIVDYLQLLSPDTKGRSNYEAVSEVSRALKAMAKDNGVAMLALAQLSRSVENRPDKRPQLADLRDSGQIEQDADAVIFLKREEYYLKQDEPEPMSEDRAAWDQLMREHGGKIEFILAKRRNGVTGSAMGQFHGAYQAVRG